MSSLAWNSFTPGVTPIQAATPASVSKDRSNIWENVLSLGSNVVNNVLSYKLQAKNLDAQTKQAQLSYLPYIVGAPGQAPRIDWMSLLIPAALILGVVFLFKKG